MEGRARTHKHTDDPQTQIQKLPPVPVGHGPAVPNGTSRRLSVPRNWCLVNGDGWESGSGVGECSRWLALSSHRGHSRSKPQAKVAGLAGKRVHQRLLTHGSWTGCKAGEGGRGGRGPDVFFSFIKVNPILYAAPTCCPSNTLS